MIFGIGLDGGMAEELIVPERALVPLPAGVRPRDACLVEPLAVNLHSLDLAGLSSGQSVAVIGGNLTGFGLLAVAGAAQRGCPVDFESGYEHQLEPALKLGARRAATRDIGQRYDLVIEGDGSEASIARAIEVCRPGGKLLLVAGYYSDKSFPSPACMVKELTMIWGTYYGHHAGGRDAEAAAALLARRPEIARSLITHRFPLEAAPEAFDLVRGPQASMKVVIEP
ncbi:MAG: zinc-binding dehydrogenase [Proteobacteria bacterium]|nr:zinc-binding dehydrogenase [Pseudomonadota bacterium]